MLADGRTFQPPHGHLPYLPKLLFNVKRGACSKQTGLRQRRESTKELLEHQTDHAEEYVKESWFTTFTTKRFCRHGVGLRGAPALKRSYIIGSLGTLALSTAPQRAMGATGAWLQNVEDGGRRPTVCHQPCGNIHDRRRQMFESKMECL